MDGNLKKRRSGRNAAGLWKIMAVVFPMGLSGGAIAYLAIEILVNTGPWGLPLIFAYLAVLLAIGIYIPQKRAKDEYHFRVGNELFYAAYPKEMKKELRKAEKRGLAQEKAAVLEKYRESDGPVREILTPDLVRRRRRGAILGFISAVMILAPVPVLAYRALSALQDLLPFSLKSDFTGLFSLLGTVLLVLNAVLVLLRKEIPQLAGTTLAVLLLNVWACFVTFSLTKKYLAADILICFGCCAVFAIGRFLVPRLTGDLRSQEQKEADQRRFALELFTLGAIDEKELKYRMTKHKTEHLS